VFLSFRAECRVELRYIEVNLIHDMVKRPKKMYTYAARCVLDTSALSTACVLVGQHKKGGDSSNREGAC
jgi:hypothetical protein